MTALRCETTGILPPDCAHCGVLSEFLAREDLPLRLEDAAVRLVEEALHLRMYGERAPGAPTKTSAETWADWDRKAEMYLRLRVADEEAMREVETTTP